MRRDRAIEDVSTAIGKKRGGTKAARVVPALTIVAHPNADRVGERALLDALAPGKELELSRNAPDFTRPGAVLGAGLGDPFVSRKPIRLAPTESGGIVLRAGDAGTDVVVGARVRGSVEIEAADIDAGVPITLADRVVLLLHRIELDVEDGPVALGMIGQSAGIRRVRSMLERVADLPVPVLIRGETGTGKELVARALHERSPRRQKPFVSVNLGAIPRELAAAELFGTEKGAFTGATSDRSGFFRAAQGGTLFLDEVGEAPPEVQVMLLRVLEAGEFYPVGGRTPHSTDVRLVAATDANLEEHIREGRFKAPLLHRLAGYELRLPPLRERREDLGILLHHFAREELQSIGEAHKLAPKDPYAEPWMPATLAARLVRFSWPGNIRQLRNVARQLVIGSRGQARLLVDPRLDAELEERAPAPAPGGSAPSAREAASAPRRKPSDVHEEELTAALQEHAWDLKAAADKLGIPRSSMYDLIERCPSIRTAGDLRAEEIERSHREHAGDLDRMAAALKVSRRALQRRVKEMGLG
ncbi:sigma 54-interacting transcriptional regulator [Polyangium sorediatum]|uniref:Sigma-54 dependent transcriptional regulator n=1 Tax=Polyangium sorediatum TaxID=889274 RepID=A0ABT6P6I7_9BACT|nr:sigma-54 dependent transcriptional regulator [Polyangium sorediatum]MDI1436222.1 sigma-54 dependent transcriptional regulator [Polyangium sorediatum]